MFRMRVQQPTFCSRGDFARQEWRLRFVLVWLHAKVGFLCADPLQKAILGWIEGGGLTGWVHQHHSVARPEAAGAQEVRRDRPGGVVGPVAGDHVRYGALRIQITVHRPVRVRLHIPPQRIHNPVPPFHTAWPRRRRICTHRLQECEQRSTKEFPDAISTISDPSPCSSEAGLGCGTA